ncbi:sugar phosphate isomerase/epimerase [Phyllobacterium sp. 21LDTY02-6]|uniref:sugar phosphate isomerase/epimerase family protein n=1 Tax=unclassified Phyllobacterium TaxID=2638441 RepID=UPI002021FA0C|nr:MULTISPECIES: sugar phosphate isomerase/epimerase family protein [unclassified Phyllobacterium]MCO4319070.1 sugar phosphate isomerase/epimerase [Phyllobacterium sp. 21LDTY02-6]MCX8279044.1 sugar phosphate isomerase/epimerase [Phyllobacterium sp. 0TCS1.6C]MCX8293828.1 sugar phosphate isomerase/epimerase [Phyllobacterium sp. 0TCS1.6A]
MTQRSIHAYTWVPQWTTEDGAYAVERAAAFGFNHVVVPIRNHENIEPTKIGRIFADAGLKPVTTSPLQIDNDISSTDRSIWKRGVERHKTALELAAAMGADRMGGILYSAFGKATRVATEDNFNAAAEGLAIVADKAKTMGMMLSLEVVNRYETNLINTASDAVRMIETIGADNVKVHLDAFHMNIEEDDMMDALETALPHLAYFEIDQNHRGSLSRGTIDFSPLLIRLKHAGYQGLVGVEAFSSAVSHPDIVAGVGAWRNLFEHGDHIAREAVELLEKHGF